MPTDTHKLDRQLGELARTPVLLVACDYDGTLAPIVTDPSRARPQPESLVALRTLAGLADTHVAVISGRSLRDLAVLSRLPSEIHLVGSHGSEFDLGFAHDLPAEIRATHDHLCNEVAAIATAVAGVRIEAKPAGVAVHYREVDPPAVAGLLQAIETGPSRQPGVHSRHGKMVVELSVVPTSKGHALETLRHQVGATAVLFLGDDVTDEDAFTVLTGPDVGVKVGEGPTAAMHRVADTVAVAHLLATFSESRRLWVCGFRAPPIERHALLSNRRTVALLTPDARVTWMCHPRADGSSIFAELLGGASAGFFSVGPPAPATPLGQRYLPGTLSVETRWPGITVVDYLDTDPITPQPTLSLRNDLVRVITGFRTAFVEFAPRLDYARSPTRMRIVDDGLEVVGAVDPIVLRSPGVIWELVDEGPHHTARAEVNLARGPVVLELRCGVTHTTAEAPPIIDRRRVNDRSWNDWARRLVVPALASEAVVRSALTLKALCHEPTGAILAAATTSLPEVIGGVRNWDYRYCWLRDGALTASALARLGSVDEGLAFLEWLNTLLTSVSGPERLRPVYTVCGQELMPEAAITQLSGYAGSRPVRIGNAAEHQLQLDVFGPVVELVDLLRQAGAPITPRHRHIVESMVSAVEQRWQEPDHGIWEIRLAPRHHVYSKVMCWSTIDRAIVIARSLDGHAPRGWTELRDLIATDVLTRGWKPDLDAFSAAYDGEDVDAASLQVGLSGLLPPDDPRFLGTIHAVELLLRDGPTVYRYRTDDGLPGFEGGFHLCTSWLVEAYHLAGRDEDARALFAQVCDLAGPTGLMSEEYDPATERSLGNFPQAYSHVGIINNAVLLGGPPP
jgi:trehalose 6-phosphate phosphatase